ncbi:MAG: putative Fe-S protein [Fibrobacteres bacterium]|nr:putative Fe-S protein [Fibrobacterota bacterium]
METPTLARITIFPIKSLDGIDLKEAMVAEGGCLFHDREFMITDGDGNPIIGKTNPLVHALRSEADFATDTVSFRAPSDGEWRRFHAVRDLAGIESWLSGYFGIPAKFRREVTGRFLDIPDIAGATLLSTATLERVSEWYPGMGLEETRKRFRATLEIEGVPAFWEDHLFANEGAAVEYRIGDVTLLGMGPRARCNVPTRDTGSGRSWPGFARSFAKRRKADLPPWSGLDRYGNHYYLTVNSYFPPSGIGKRIRVGDAVRIVGEGGMGDREVAP